jgi:CBS-domain-containing membrane protein
MGTQHVRDVMTELVIVVRPDTGYKQMVDVLVDFAVSAVPVVDDDGCVLGVVSEADLLHKAEFADTDLHARLFDRRSRKAAKAKAAGDTASELMSSPAVTIKSAATIGEAARLMDSQRVKRLPVVDDTGLLVGIVSRRDLLRPYLQPDSGLERAVRDQVLRRTLWADPQAIEVAVSGGVVTLSGTADRRSTAQIAARLTRAVDGVVDVVDEMTWEFDDTAVSRQGHVFDASRR